MFLIPAAIAAAKAAALGAAGHGVKKAFSKKRRISLDVKALNEALRRKGEL